jgi:NCS1 family nucleobase:cation symporter-1
MALFICIGAITGLIMSQSGILSSDPTDWLIALGGAKLGLIALFLIGVANISTAAAGTYTLCLSTKIIKPEISYLKVAAIWGIWCCILTIWGGAWTYYPERWPLICQKVIIKVNAEKVGTER